MSPVRLKSWIPDAPSLRLCGIVVAVELWLPWAEDSLRFMDPDFNDLLITIMPGPNFGGWWVKLSSPGTLGNHEKFKSMAVDFP